MNTTTKHINTLFSHHRFVVLMFLCVFILGTRIVLAQDRQELERNKQQIEREIVLINQLLQETQSTAELNLSQLVITNNKIQSRKNLITSISNEIDFINRRINEINNEKEQLENELKALRESYARMIFYAQKNRNSYQRMMFLFSSRDFNQAYLRLRYLQQLTRHRQIQAEKIVETSDKLQQSVDQLEEQKQEQQELLVRQNEEISVLNQERNEQAKNVDRLKSKEKELMQQLREQEKAAQDLQRAIQEVIAEERRRAAEAAREQGRSVSEAFRLTPEERLLSDNFAENKGKLPWPLERGIITGSFGEQPHPVLPGITIVNNGIDISTTQGSAARAIFEGTVSRVLNIPGGYAVIVRHGEYLSVYSNLSEVFVNNGQRVLPGDEIGIAATDTREAQTFVHLEIWYGNKKQNPADWITRQR